MPDVSWPAIKWSSISEAVVSSLSCESVDLDDSRSCWIRRP